MKRTLFCTVIVLVVILVTIIFKSSPPNVVEPIVVHPIEPIPSITIYPEVIYPGDPIFITIHSSSTASLVLYDAKPLKTFMYKDTLHALVPVDFTEKILEHVVTVTLANGVVATSALSIIPREKIERNLGIPEKLGGNTSESSLALIKKLAEENASLASVKTASTSLWSYGFRYPLAAIFITDDYGYDRKTVEQTIVHKGTDLRAVSGTEVFAMNDGIVEIAAQYTVYGNTIVIDHGLGVHTLYMHLSKLGVKKGDTVKKGDGIGLSGETGYAEAPHLHLSVRINNISIDPVTFLSFFK